MAVRWSEAALLLLALSLTLLCLSPASAWERAHADAANSGFVDVRTARAGAGSRSVPGLGSFAPGSGPVVAPDGTVYLGTEQGRLVALHADGSPYWTRDLPSGQAIVSSPAIGADGMVYVVGVARYRDHRAHAGGANASVVRYESTLYRFTAGGGMLNPTPFPELYATLPGFRGRGVASAPPNIWNIGGVETVMVPVVYNTPGGYDVRLVAFATTGAVQHEVRVTHVAYEVTGENDANVLCYFPILGQIGCAIYPLTSGFQATNDPSHSPDVIDVDALSYPGVAIAGANVVVSDRVHDIVGYSYSPVNGFTEIFRKRDPQRFLASTPTYLPGGQVAVGAAGHGSDGALVVAVNPAAQGPVDMVTGLGAVYAAPTLLGDGRLVAVEYLGGLTVLRQTISGIAIQTRRILTGQSIAAAAASRSHVFVSTANAFITYDKATMAQIAQIDWFGGGVSSPAIGPQGHVYAIASNILFVFPPPAPCLACDDISPARWFVARRAR